MKYCATGIAIITALAASIAGNAVAQQSNSENSVPLPDSNEVNVMPPVGDAAASAEDVAPALLPMDAAPPQADEPAPEMELVTRGIYQCMDRGKAVFVDEESLPKYRQSECKQIRAPYYQQVDSGTSGSGQRPACSGAILYKGSTYVFSDKEPCPIPEEVFDARKPIEANPEYYTPPTS